MRQVLLAMALGLLPAFAAAELRPFQAGSLAEVEQHFVGEPFLLVLWSVDCAPCYGELEMLGRLKQQYPQLNLALVSTDPVAMRDETAKVLKEYRLDIPFNWIFADAHVERLRYRIDPDWFGELPRSYFYDRQHRRRGVSGVLDERQIREWINVMPEYGVVSGVGGK